MNIVFLIQIPPTEFMERENIVCTGFKVKILSLSFYNAYKCWMDIKWNAISKNKQTNKITAWFSLHELKSFFHAM